MFAAMMHARFVIYRRYLAEKRNKKEFDAFEATLLAPEASGGSSRFFSGETQLQSETTIYLPGYEKTESFVEPLVVAIHEGLEQRSLGFVIRCFPYDRGIGIDVQLTDFVTGLEVLREILLTNNVPRETFVEYETGELPVYDQETT